MLTILLVPFALVFLASAARAYPLTLRTELFLVPATILLVTEGITQLVEWTPTRWRALAALVLVAVIASGPVYEAGARLVHPRQNEEMRPVLEFIRGHWQSGDELYVHYGAQYAFAYYDECGCLRLTHEGRKLWPIRPVGGTDSLAPAIVSTTPALIVGRYHDEPRRYIADLRKLKGRGRVWFLYSHYTDDSEKRFIQRDLIGTLNNIGERLNAIDRPRAHAYLYDLK